MDVNAKGAKTMSVTVYMIENTTDNTFWTNNVFKKDHGNLYRDPKIAQKQIDTGKLAMFIRHGFDVTADEVKISKFKLERDES